MQFPPASLNSPYLPYHHESILCQHERPSFTPKQYKRQTYSLVYLNLFLESGYEDKRF
jgi:hypothetical protein